MSSKLVKKGLDFVSSANESKQEKSKNSQKKKRKSRKRGLNASHQGLPTNEKGITIITSTFNFQFDHGIVNKFHSFGLNPGLNNLVH